MGFRVQYVDDDELPAERDWFMARVADVYYFAVKRSAVLPEVLEDAWGAYGPLLDAPPTSGRHSGDDRAPRETGDAPATPMRPSRPRSHTTLESVADQLVSVPYLNRAAGLLVFCSLLP